MSLLRGIALLLMAVGLVIVPVYAQDGSGVVVIGNLSGSSGLSPLPIGCAANGCDLINALLYPTLLQVDPVTSRFGPALVNGYALAVGWAITRGHVESGDVSGEMTVDFLLTPDLKWSDGTPVTAYDVFYTYLAIRSQGGAYAGALNQAVSGAVPLNEHDIVFIYRQSNCNPLDPVNIPIMPAHAYDPQFTATASAFFNANDPSAEQFARWLDTDYVPILSPANTTVTIGDFQLDSIVPPDYVRLLRGSQAINLVDESNQATADRAFLTGDLSVIVNPLYEDRADIRAAPDVQLFQSTSTGWYAVGLNLADPDHPNSRVDRKGTPLDQGANALFGDLRVRRALQMALDVNGLIAGAVQGDASPSQQIDLPRHGRIMAIFSP